MKILKNLALSLLGFLLFLTLSAFGTVFMLNNTLLNPDFVAAEINRLDISSLVGEMLVIESPPEAPYLNRVINEAIAENEPHLKKEASAAVYSGYDYLMGRMPNLSLSISLQPVKESLRDKAWQAFLASPPPQLATIPQAMWEPYFDQFYQQLDQQIPSTIEFTENSLPPETRTQVEQARQAMGYYQLLYQVLLGLMLLLVLGIILISREVKDITRRLGTPCLTYGVLGYASVLALKYFDGTTLVDLTAAWLQQPELPAPLQAWLSQFMTNLLAPLEMFNLALLITGAVLIIVSFVYRRGQPSA